MMTPEEVVATVQKDTVAIVVRYNLSDGLPDAAHLSALLETIEDAQEGQGVAIIVVPKGIDIETLDQDKMLQAGWVRKSDA